jgi:cytochrome c6
MPDSGKKERYFMKNQLSAATKLTVALIPVILVALVSFATPKATMTKADFAPLAANFGDASSNYVKYCNRCHGADGHSQTAKGKQTGATDLTKSKIGDTAGIKIISNGKELMPGFKENMSAEEIKALMTFVRGLRK